MFPKPSRIVFLTGLILAALIFVQFAPALGYGFVNYDDFEFYTDGPFRQEVVWQTPLLMVTCWLEWKIFGMNAFVPHLVNILWHIVDCLLLFALMLRILRRLGKVGTLTVAAAGFGTLLFAIHPLRVEEVVWVSGRKEIMYSFFYLVGLHLYITYAERRGPAVISCVKDPLWWGTLLCFALSIFTKFSGVSLFVTLVLWDYVFHPREWGRRLPEKIPFVLLGVVCALTVMMGGYRNDLVTLAEAPPLFRLLNAGLVMGFYFQRTLMPVDLVPFYILYEEFGRLTPLEVVSALATYVMLGILFWKGNRAVRASVLFYGAALGPVLGIINAFSFSAADRYTYMPTMIFFVWLTAGLLWWGERTGAGSVLRRKVVRAGLLGVAALVVATLSVLTYRQTAIWKDSHTLWRHQLTVNPHPRFFELVGDMYFNEGQYSKALAGYLSAMAHIEPTDVLYQKAGISCLNLGLKEPALGHLLNGLRLNPRNGDIYWVLSQIEEDPARRRVLEQKAVEYRPALRDRIRQTGK
ncbi:MAG: hypothetical protein SFY92_04270 [Verrucomicrobiae bacterium]|nr:hypothetical protein [Verrucomicrobiae bacterium]